MKCVILNLLLVSYPLAALAQSQPDSGTLNGSTTGVNNGLSGDQTDPHVSGDEVSYTDDSTGSLDVRYHNLQTGSDSVIPNDGGNDQLSGISGSTIVYMHQDTSGSYTVETFDISTAGPSVPIDPEPGSFRSTPAIGGGTVAWVDFTTNPALPEIIEYSLDAGTTTTIAADSYANVQPAVSPDGTVITWAKCDPSGTPCNVWEAINSAGTWTSSALTTGTNDSEQPHTDGTLVVYQSTRAGETDIYWQPVGGGTEQHLIFPGSSANPHITGDFMALEHAPNTTSLYDIYVYDLANNTLYQITNTPGSNNTLDDISEDSSGIVHVVWASQQAGQPSKVYAFSFQAPSSSTGQCQGGDGDGDGDDGDGNRRHERRHHWDDLLDVCQDPGTRPLLGELSVTRGSSGDVTEAATSFPNTTGSKEGVLCVYNSGAASGDVVLNGWDVASSCSFSGWGGWRRDGDDDHDDHASTLIARDVWLESQNSLDAYIGGDPGASYTVKVFGPSCDSTSPWQKATHASLHLNTADPSVFVSITGTRYNEVATGEHFVDSAPHYLLSGMGCDSTGGTAGAVATLIVLAAVGMSRRRALAPSRSRRDGRR